MDRRAAITLTVGLGLAAFAPATATAQSSWHQVTGIDGIPARNIDEVGLERSADGVLHVAWTRTQAGGDELLHTPIAPDGIAVGAPTQIYGAGGASLNTSADLAAGPGGGLRVFFAAIDDGQPHNTVMATATAPQAGTPWSAPVAASNNAPGTNSSVSAASGIGAAVAAGVPISIWGDSSPSGGGIHVGVDPATPDAPLSPECCQVNPNVGVDAITGEAVAAWSDVGTIDALQVRPVPTGPTQLAPASGGLGIDQRVSISGRIGAPGIFAAYGAGSNPLDAKPALWQVGSQHAKVVPEEKGEHAVLAPAPGGRMWMAWDTDGGSIHALRTNAAATEFGAPVNVKPPSGTSAIYRLAAEGSLGDLDLLALVETPQGLGYWHRRVLPGLSLKAKPKTPKAGSMVTFTIADAGDPVSGAKVKLKLFGRNPVGTTRKSGKVTLAIPKGTNPGRYGAKATKAGYVAAKAKVRVKGG